MNRPKLGQHFLTSVSALKKIVEALEIKEGETVIEIGAGHGELTVPLARVCRDAGAKLIAIEKDPELAFSFKLLGSSEKVKSEFEIINGDALKILPEIIKNYKLKPKSYKLVGNIPYYLTGYLLRLISTLAVMPRRSVFTLQAQVAERIIAEPPHMSRLAAAVQFWAKPKILGLIPKKHFRPMPKVDSAIVVLEGRPAPDINTEPHGYYDALRILFRQPRKTILNNLFFRTEKSGNPPRLEKENLIKKLSELGIDSGDRPQNLSVVQIIRIAEFFHKS